MKRSDTLVSTTMTKTMMKTGTTKTEHRVFHSMGIPVHITFSGTSREHADKASEAAANVFSEYDMRFSRFKDASELMALNNAAGVWHKVSIPFYQVLKKCVTLAEETGGVFDPSVGCILASYGYGLPTGYVLPEKLPTYRDIAFNDRELSVRLAPRQVLEPACVVKSMAIDAAGQAIKQILPPDAGFMINAGGDIFTHGTLSAYSPWWNIVIQDPEDPNAIVTAVGVRNVGVATSGTYQTRGKHHGKEWHHLINMKTAHPASEIVSATVIAPTAEEADIEASLAILLPPPEALARLEKKKYPYFLIHKDRKVSKSTSFAAREVPVEQLVGEK